MFIFSKPEHGYNFLLIFLGKIFFSWIMFKLQNELEDTNLLTSSN